MIDNDLQERVRLRLEQLNRSPITAATSVGLERTYIRDFVGGKKKSIGMDKMALVARALDWTMGELLGQYAKGNLNSPALRPIQPVQPVRSVEPVGQIIPGDQLVGARDFPIYAAAQGGNGYMIVHTDVMEYVKRPVILEGVPDSYGILITGDSMIPAFRPNDMALVHPRRPPERETDVILFDHDHRTGDAHAMVKRLLGFNDRSWKLEQYNPSKTFSEHRADWPLCHQVVGKYNAR